MVLAHADNVLAAERVAVDVSEVAAAQVLGDPEQLGVAVANLADNAARHATSGIAFTLREHGDTAVLTVSDDGPGIPVEDHERVFERFARLDAARGRSSGGVGVGLAISRDVVRRHGGSLVVDADGGPGARLVMTLPLVTAHRV
jgi:signal transduction histidine kinase